MRTPEILRRALFFFAFLCLFPRVGQAIIPRNVSVDIGVGVPHLVFGQGIIKISDHWQAGIGYGIIPGLNALGKDVSLGDQVMTLGGTTEVKVTPILNASFNTLLPFVRFFPRENNFYLQATYAMLQIKADVTGTMKTNDVLAIPAGLLGGTISVTQPIPTISVGHVWASEAFFWDISLGFSFFLPASVGLALNTLIPDALGGTEGNQGEIDKLAGEMETELNKATLQYRDRYPIIPSLSLTFGILL